MAKLDFVTMHRAKYVAPRVEWEDTEEIHLVLDKHEANTIYTIMDRYWRESGKSFDISHPNNRNSTSINASGLRVIAALAAQISKIRN